MNKEKIYPQERLLKIMEYLKRKGSMEVEQLSKLFDLSSATIRSDLRELENKGLIIRTHGGAILKDNMNELMQDDSDPVYNSRILQNVASKEAIGKTVAKLINDGDSIMLDDGSTTLQVAKNLPLKKEITVITNGFNICVELSDHPDVSVIATGGTMNKADLSYHGRVAEEVTMKFNASKAILGASGISIKNGITAPNEMKAELKKVMIKNSAELIIVADHSKMSRISPVTVCSLDKISTLVTDRQAPEDLLNMLKDNGVNVIVV